MRKQILTLLIALFIISCTDNRSRNIQFMPDMYESEAYEPYSESKSPLIKTTALKPVIGTIPRGYIPYEIPNTNEGYELSKKDISPLENYDEAKAKELYNIYCAICHGDTGDGRGTLVKNDKFLGVPAFKDREINEGSIFFVETYGKGVMGSHASQINANERWHIARFVMSLRNNKQ